MPMYTLYYTTQDEDINKSEETTTLNINDIPPLSILFTDKTYSEMELMINITKPNFLRYKNIN